MTCFLGELTWALTGREAGILSSWDNYSIIDNTGFSPHFYVIIQIPWSCFGVYNSVLTHNSLLSLLFSNTTFSVLDWNSSCYAALSLSDHCLVFLLWLICLYAPSTVGKTYLTLTLHSHIHTFNIVLIDTVFC